MGIASTLVIVRSAMGIAIQDEKTFKETVLEEFRARQPTQQSDLDNYQEEA
ncbi:hypothetical protein V5O48_016308 [Marasmius crinis-equi]|uniref:Uncharacterized protein n=1 Tax=Marasmius crinis-equi TaxID=585013 RepID=A0ABR3ES29_9AGAR